MPSAPRPLIPRYRWVTLPAIGPCFFVAPIVAVLAVVALVAWPFVVVGAVVPWLLTWPLERLLVALGVGAARGLFARATRVMRLLAMPWSWFDGIPRPGAAQAPMNQASAAGAAPPDDPAPGSAPPGTTS